MAEVLSQSQIDALLNSIGDGNFDKNKEDESDEKKYRKYDFYSPKKFTKDKLKILKGVYESYARMVSSRLNSVLRTSCEVEVATVEEQRFYEFSNALSDNDVLTLVEVNLPVKSENAPLILHSSTQLMLSMIDRMLGGTGEDAQNIELNYTYTDIELALYENIIKYIIGVMGDAWSNYLDLKFNFSKLETNPSLMQDIGVDETIAIIVMDVDMGVVKGKINIVMPGSMLTNIFSIFDQRSGASLKNSKIEEHSSEHIFESIKDSALEMTASLGETKILLSDVYNLHVGDVINLNKPKESDVCLYIEGKPWFKGKLGIQNKNMAIKINEACDNS